MMSQVPVAWKINQSRLMHTEPLWAALAEIETYSEERSSDESEEEAEAWVNCQLGG